MFRILKLRSVGWVIGCIQNGVNIFKRESRPMEIRKNIFCGEGLAIILLSDYRGLGVLNVCSCIIMPYLLHFSLG